MPISPQDALYGFAAPALVAAAVFWIASRFLSESARERWPASLALIAGFLTGYALLKLEPWQPTSYWHWTPYVLALAAVIGSVSAAQGISLIERLLLYAAAAWIAAWFLVPNYDDLEPSRMTYLIVWPLYLLAIAYALDLLSRQLTGPLLPTVVTLSMAAGLVIVFLSGSAKFMQLYGFGFAAMGGVALGSLFSKEKPALLGAALLATMLSAGYLLVAKTQSFSSIPMVCYALPPVAPVTLWISQWKPLAQRPGITGLILRLLVPAVVCGVAVGLAAWAERDALSEL